MLWGCKVLLNSVAGDLILRNADEAYGATELKGETAEKDTGDKEGEWVEVDLAEEMEEKVPLFSHMDSQSG